MNMKKLLLSIVGVVIILFGARSYSVPSEEMKSETPTHPFQLIPGKTLRLSIPQFLANDNKKRVCEVRIPESYRPEASVPILVWFGPGGGSSHVSSIPSIVDKTKFLLVALPYPDNRLPRLAIKAGHEKIDEFWEYEKPMMEYIKDVIPNIHPTIRIAAGFSSGAHLVASGLDRDWNGFTDFFTAYILHEGGYSPDMKFRGVNSHHKILVTYGLQNDSYGRVVAREMKKSGVMPTVKKLGHTGHSMSQESIDAIKEWIGLL